MNSLFGMSKEIMLAGLKQNKVINLPHKFWDLAQEVYNVPEKPTSFKPKKEKLKLEHCVLVSGGLDSTVLYFRIKSKFENVRAFYFGIGSPYEEKERIALDNLQIKYEYYSLIETSKKNYWKHIIPARNFLFITKATELLRGRGIIYFAATNGEMPERGGDKSKRFFRMINTLLKEYSPMDVKVVTPLDKEVKTDLVRWWIKNLPIERLDLTVSCFNPSKTNQCGKCQSCLRKYIAYKNNGLKLRTDIDVLEGCKEYIKKYLGKMSEAMDKKDFSHYTKKRCLETLQALNYCEKNES